jgi:hypothetical protein
VEEVSMSDDDEELEAHDAFERMKLIVMGKFADHWMKQYQASWLEAMRTERKHRLKYIVKLGAELDRIESVSMFGTAWGKAAIEAIIEGDYEELKRCYVEDLDFDDGLTAGQNQPRNDEYTELWAKFKQLCEECIDNRPNDEPREGTH